VDRAALLRHAFALLANRPHSRSELYRKLLTLSLRREVRLRKFGAANIEESFEGERLSSTKLVASIVDELIDRGVLNDSFYALWHTEQRVVGGAHRSRAQLLGEISGTKRVDFSLTEAAIVEFHNELEACANISLRRSGLSVTRLKTFLHNKAFTASVVDTVMRVYSEEGKEGLMRLVREQREKRGDELR